MENNELYFATKKDITKYKIKNLFKNSGLYIILSFFALFTLIPFYWMIISSLKSANEISTTFTLFPKNITFENFSQVILGSSSGSLGRYIINTLIVGVLTTVISIVITVLSAFAFARLSFKGREFLFALLLSTMMIPGEMMIITNFTTVSLLGWINSYTALIVPFTASVFYTFFLRQTFKQIPDELYYAAKVDGNSDFKYLWKVMIPIAKPTIITITILSVIGSWNAYIWPRTVSSSNSMKLVTDGLMYLFKNEDQPSSDNVVMAAAFVVSVPLLITFLLLKKHIMRGVSRSGIKG